MINKFTLLEGDFEGREYVIIAILERENFKIELVQTVNSDRKYYISYRYGGDWSLCKISKDKFGDRCNSDLKIEMNEILDREVLRKLKRFESESSKYFFTPDQYMMFPSGTKTEIIKGFLLNNISKVNKGRADYETY